jgi:hypothetical protein
LQILEDSLQRVWALQGFEDGDWRTENGERIRVLHGGRWNRGKGPDFMEAVLEIGGVRRTGDVEIHLYPEDWVRHGHHLDTAYNRVILHVLGFKSRAKCLPQTRLREDGESLEEWWAGAWVPDDWEHLSNGELGLLGNASPELKDWAENIGHLKGKEQLKTGAEERWQGKLRQCRDLISLFGWQESVRRLLLYTLGYPQNRGSFLELADKIEPDQWRVITLKELKVIAGERIKWRVGRPANHADKRLASYLKFARRRPEHLHNWECASWDWLFSVKEIGVAGQQSAISRKSLGISGLRRRWESELADVWRGGMIDRLMVDVIMPMICANCDKRAEDLMPIWFHWYAGALPDRFDEVLKLMGIGVRGGEPITNGWMQGVVRKEEDILLSRLAGGRA